MENILPNGPFTIELTIAMTDGEQQANVSYELPKGKYPSKKDIKETLAGVLGEMNERFPDSEWRLLDKREFFDSITPEGITFAMFGFQDFVG